MYPIAIGYAYAVFLAALASGSLLSGLFIAVFRVAAVGLHAAGIGLASRGAARRSMPVAIHPALGQGAGAPDGEHAQADQ